MSEDYNLTNQSPEIYQHRGDEQILVVNNADTFLQASQDLHTRGVILERAPAETSDLRNEFEKVRKTITDKHRRNFLEMTFGAVSPGRLVTFSQDPGLSSVEDELKAMANTYHQISGKNEIIVTLSQRDPFKTHTEGIGFLSCTWRRNTLGGGSVWQASSGGKIHQAPEGAWFYAHPQLKCLEPLSVKHFRHLLVIARPMP